MIGSLDVSLILPAYNEASTIGNTIDEAVRYFTSRNLRYEIIVPADGNDGTREVVAELTRENSALRAIGDKQRLGKGRGVRMAAALASGAVVGYADADNKVPIDEYDKIAAQLAGGWDIVIGSRASDQAEIQRKQPLYRRVGSMGFAVVMRAITGVGHISDTQCGFKFFRADTARRIFANQQIDGYMFDVEILALASHFGYRVKEVPIRWRDDGDSRLELVRGNIRNMRELFAIRASLRDLQSHQSLSSVLPEAHTRGHH